MGTEVTAAQVADKALDKAEVLITKAAETAGDMFEAASNIVTKGIEQYGQAAIDAVLWVVRIDALQALVTAYLIILAFAIGWYFVLKNIRTWFIEFAKADAEPFIILGFVVALGFTTVFAFPYFAVATDVWKYTAVIKPELYIVKQTVDLAKKKLDNVVATPRGK